MILGIQGLGITVKSKEETAHSQNQEVASSTDVTRTHGRDTQLSLVGVRIREGFLEEMTAYT